VNETNKVSTMMIDDEHDEERSVCTLFEMCVY
jgi:hypothetical protein